MLAMIAAATLLGAVGRPVTVEVHVSSGLPGFTVVGLPDEACREAERAARRRNMSPTVRALSAVMVTGRVEPVSNMARA